MKTLRKLSFNAALSLAASFGLFASAAPLANAADMEQASAASKDGQVAVDALQALAKEMIEMADKDADLQKGNLAKAMEVVDKRVMPLLDKEGLAKRSMGKYWREANPEQRARLSVAIPRLLGKTYARMLFDLRGSTVEFGSPRSLDGLVKVSAKVKSNSASPTIVAFAVSVSEGKVLVQDVVLEGVSLMGAFAGNFTQIAAQKGIDGLIKDIESKL